MNIFSSIIVLGLAICVIILLLITIKYVFPNKKKVLVNGILSQEPIQGSEKQEVAKNIENSNKNIAFIGKSSKFATSKNTILEVIHLENGNVMVIEEYLVPDENFGKSREEVALEQSVLQETPNFREPADFVDDSYSEQEQVFMKDIEAPSSNNMSFSEEQVDQLMGIQTDLFNGNLDNSYEISTPTPTIAAEPQMDFNPNISPELNSLPANFKLEEENSEEQAF